MTQKHEVSMGYCENCNMPADACNKISDCSQLTYYHYVWIRDATWSDMNRRYGSFHRGDSIFLGETGKYFHEQMALKAEGNK
jgi:hypothetical protein